MDYKIIKNFISREEQNDLVKWIMNNKDNTELFKDANMNGNRITTRYSLHDFAIGQYVVIGLIGTIIGVAIAFSNMPSDISYNDPESLQLIVSTLLDGLKVAFYTTLLGGVCSFWLTINRYILNIYSSKLFREVLGENAELNQEGRG